MILNDPDVGGFDTSYANDKPSSILPEMACAKILQFSFIDNI